MILSHFRHEFVSSDEETEKPSTPSPIGKRKRAESADSKSVSKQKFKKTKRVEKSPVSELKQQDPESPIPQFQAETHGSRIPFPAVIKIPSPLPKFSFSPQKPRAIESDLQEVPMEVSESPIVRSNMEQMRDDFSRSRHPSDVNYQREAHHNYHGHRPSNWVENNSTYHNTGMPPPYQEEPPPLPYREEHPPPPYQEEHQPYGWNEPPRRMPPRNDFPYEEDYFEDEAPYYPHNGDRHWEKERNYSEGRGVNYYQRRTPNRKETMSCMSFTKTYL